MDSKKIILAVIGLATALAAAAQNVSDLILSEAVPCNTQGVTDGYGRHTGWVEITNTSQGTANFGGCFLTDDRTRPQRYMIPKGDASTRLGPRQVTLLWCGGNADEGTYYTNFTLTPGGTVYLVSNDGKTFIDSLSIPAALPADMAVRKVARDNKKMDFRTEAQPAVPSPMTMNTVGIEETGAQRMARTDPNGWILTLTSVSVVFAALIILWWIFTGIGRAFTRKGKAAPKKETPKKEAPADEAVAAAIALALDMEQDGDTYAAIALALHLYLSESVHDTESYVITIRPTAARHETFRKLPR